MANRQAIIILIQASAPQRPACFNSDEDWKRWLASAHSSGLKVVRRVTKARWTPDRRDIFQMLPTKQIPYCDSCLAGHQRDMQQRGRCFPSDVTTDEPEPHPSNTMRMSYA